MNIIKQWRDTCIMDESYVACSNESIEKFWLEKLAEQKEQIIKKVSKRVLKYEGELFRGEEIIKIIQTTPLSLQV